jgi:hypothetical protein
MLNYPDIEYLTSPRPSVLRYSTITEDEALLYAVVMRKLADQVFRYMAKAGSNVRIFSVQPPVVPEISDRPLMDENGQRWPDYVFCKSWAVDATGKEEVIAAPVAQSQIQMPISTALSYRFG